MQIFKLKKITRKKTRKKSQKKYITAQVTSLNQLIALTKQKLNSCLHKKKSWANWYPKRSILHKMFYVKIRTEIETEFGIFGKTN